jgi:hypothetical protein
MAKTPRSPSPPKATRAGKDMHSSNPKVRKEAGEVLSLIPRKPKRKSK